MIRAAVMPGPHLPIELRAIPDPVLELARAIGARFGLERAGEALAAVEARRVTKAVIVPGLA